MKKKLIYCKYLHIILCPTILFPQKTKELKGTKCICNFVWTLSEKEWILNFMQKAAVLQLLAFLVTIQVLQNRKR